MGVIILTIQHSPPIGGLQNDGGQTANEKSGIVVGREPR